MGSWELHADPWIFLSYVKEYFTSVNSFLIITNICLELFWQILRDRRVIYLKIFELEANRLNLLCNSTVTVWRSPILLRTTSILHSHTFYRLFRQSGSFIFQCKSSAVLDFQKNVRNFWNTYQCLYSIIIQRYVQANIWNLFLIRMKNLFSKKLNCSRWIEYVSVRLS